MEGTVTIPIEELDRMRAEIIQLTKDKEEYVDLVDKKYESRVENLREKEEQLSKIEKKYLVKTVYATQSGYTNKYKWYTENEAYHNLTEYSLWEHYNTASIWELLENRRIAKRTNRYAFSM